MKITIVIPAAGNATRLGGVCKLLQEINGRSVAAYTHDKIVRVKQAIDAKVDYIFVVAQDLDIISPQIEFPNSPGMACSVFAAYEIFKDSDLVVVMWGDALGITSATLIHAIRVAMNTKRVEPLVVPLCSVNEPYTAWRSMFDIFNFDISQRREGDAMPLKGMNDCGLFVFSNPQQLFMEWLAFKESCKGKITKEYNFLPLVKRMVKSGFWTLKPLEMYSEANCRGLNTPEDLAYWESHSDYLSL